MEKDLVARLEAAVARLESLSSAGSKPPPSSSRDLPSAAAVVDLPTDPSIVAFDELVEKSLARVSSAAYKIGGKVLEATKILKEAFAAEKELLVRARLSQKPDMVGLTEFLKPLNDVIVKANSLTEGKRSDVFNHLKAAADSLSALAWIAYSGKDCGMSLPIAHVEESWQMAEFYNNKILVEYRNKNPEHVEWAKALKELYVPGLRDYVKANYPLGPVWGPTGGVITSTLSVASSTPKATPARAPAPPPPPSSSLFTSETSSSRSKEGMSAVFQEISSGKPVTAGLKKVTDDMKAKNRTDRSGVVTAAAKGSPTSSFSFSKTGPPKLELQMGRKWVVENQVGKKNLAIDDCDARQSVYVYGCKDSVLQVRGKVNNITVDKCIKMGIVFTDVVAAFEIVNCNGVEVQSQGSAPTISIDNTAGCQLYLSKESLQTSITTAKSSEINVLVPGEGPDADWVHVGKPIKSSIKEVKSQDNYTKVSIGCGRFGNASFGVLGMAYRFVRRLKVHVGKPIKSSIKEVKSQDNYTKVSIGCGRFGNASFGVLGMAYRFVRRLKGEHALPQQFVHTFQDGHFVTNPLSHSGG